jgi:hypothetical protein
LTVPEIITRFHNRAIDFPNYLPCRLVGERISGSYGTGHRSSSDPGSSTSRSRFAQHPIHRHGRKASLPPDPDGPSHLTKRHEQRQTRPLS